jgi:hypothetical protein
MGCENGNVADRTRETTAKNLEDGLTPAGSVSIFW